MKKEFILGCLAALPLFFPSAQAAGPDFRTNINPALLYFQAYQAFPQPKGEDEWRTDEDLDERRLEILRGYDNAFKLARRARFAKVPCDWGYDISDGPEALLPGLAPAKRLALVARLRARVALEEGNFDKVREELASAFVLGRQLATDHILISCLVQIAIENILSTVIMENYYRFTADELDQLLAAWDAAPCRGTIADTIGATERDAFFGYIERKVAGMIAAAQGNESAFWVTFAKFWNPIATESEGGGGPNPNVEKIKETAGGSSAGLLRLLGEMPSLYEETARVLALPYLEYQTQAPQLWGKISRSQNPLVTHFFSAFRNVRGREFGIVTRLEMLRLAAAYKRSGEKALEAVKDPLTGGTFEFSRVQVDGVDRAFKLKSKERFRDFDEVAIFVEKPGRAIRLEGSKAGSPL